MPSSSTMGEERTFLAGTANDTTGGGAHETHRSPITALYVWQTTHKSWSMRIRVGPGEARRKENLLIRT